MNAAVAPKANDSAVVHLSGSEVISGTKQFAVAPTLPTPLHAGDATNKTYVDNAVSNVGSGNYVSKAGDTMTGPLNLPSDPVASNQATTKHYVDVGIAGTAGLVAGVVPAGELGTGTATRAFACMAILPGAHAERAAMLPRFKAFQSRRLLRPIVKSSPMWHRLDNMYPKLVVELRAACRRSSMQPTSRSHNLLPQI